MPKDELTVRRLRSGEELRERLRAVRGEPAGRDPGALDLDPRSAYELLTRQMVSDLAEELREILSYSNKSRAVCGPKTSPFACTDQLPASPQAVEIIPPCGPPSQHKCRR